MSDITKRMLSVSGNRYTVDLIQPLLSYPHVRIAPRNFVQDEVRMTLPEFIALLDWGNARYDELQQMAKEQVA